MNPIRCLVLFCFFFSSLGPLPFAQADSLALPSRQAGLPKLLTPTAPFKPVLLKGLKVFADQPFKMDFLIDQGQGKLSAEESKRLIKYFLAGLTIPNGDLWVNLSPYEKNRIIPESFGQTAMGVDVLSQDYILKQLTASLIYPESESGKLFWAKVYAKAQEKLGTTNIPVNTFNKVWIVPQEALVYEKQNIAYIAKAQLKVMLEEDYLAKEKNQLPTRGHVPERAIIREIIIPILEHEVNEGAHFAQLRQVYHALILATWYKKKIKASLIARAYVDQKKTSGLKENVIASAESTKHSDIETIYQEYIQTFKKGVFNYINEEPDPTTGEIIPRKYFSGGAGFEHLNDATRTEKVEQLPAEISSQAMSVAHANFEMASSIDELKKTRDYQIHEMTKLGGLSGLSFSLYLEKGEAYNVLQAWIDEMNPKIAELYQFTQEEVHDIKDWDRRYAVNVRDIYHWLEKREKEVDSLLKGKAEEAVINQIKSGILSFMSDLLFYSRTDFTLPIKRPLDLLNLLRSFKTEEGFHTVEISGENSLIVEADQEHLRSVFDNLLNNAIDAAKLAKLSAVKVEVSVQRVGDKAKIVFKDNGPGMPVEKADAFKNEEPVPSSKPTGDVAKDKGKHGIGTQVIRTIIKFHGGDIEVSSQTEGPNHGTTFTITLPISPAMNSASEIEQVEGYETIEQLVRSGNLRGKAFEITFKNDSPTLSITGGMQTVDSFETIGKNDTALRKGDIGVEGQTRMQLDLLRERSISDWKSKPTLIVGSGEHWLELGLYIKEPGTSNTVEVLEPDLDNILKVLLYVQKELQPKERERVVIRRGNILELQEKRKYGLIQAIRILVREVFNNRSNTHKAIDNVVNALAEKGILISDADSFPNGSISRRVIDDTYIWQKDIEAKDVKSLSDLKEWLKTAEAKQGRFKLELRDGKPELTLQEGRIPYDEDIEKKKGLLRTGNTEAARTNLRNAFTYLENKNEKDLRRKKLMIIGPGKHGAEIDVFLNMDNPPEQIYVVEPSLANMSEWIERVQGHKDASKIIILRDIIQGVEERNIDIIYSSFSLGTDVIGDDQVKHVIDKVHTILKPKGLFVNKDILPSRGYFVAGFDPVVEEGLTHIYRKKPANPSQLSRDEGKLLDFSGELAQEAFSMDRFTEEVKAVALRGKMFEIGFNSQGIPELKEKGYMPQAGQFNSSPEDSGELKKRDGFAHLIGSSGITSFLDFLIFDKDEALKKGRALLIGPGNHWLEARILLEKLSTNSIDIIEPDLNNVIAGVRIMNALPVEQRSRCLIRRMRAEDMIEQERYGIIYSNMVFSDDIPHEEGTLEKVERALSVGGVLQGHSRWDVPNGYEHYYSFDKNKPGSKASIFRKVSPAMNAVAAEPMVKMKVEKPGGIDLNHLEEQLQSKGADTLLEFPAHLDEAAALALDARLTSLMPTITSIETNITPAQFWLN